MRDGVNEEKPDAADGKPEAAESGGKADARRSPREIIADYERYKYELYKEKYIHGN